MQFRERRRSTSFDVILEDETGQHRAAIIDVTLSGARLQLENANFEAECQVHISLRGKNYPARIVWCRDNQAGLAFKEMLSLETLGIINRSMRKPQIPKKKRFVMR